MAPTRLPRILNLTSPHMRGSDVRIVQQKIGGAGRVDGAYGPVTAGAVRDWKWRVGFSKKHINNRLHPGESEYFLGRKRDKLMIARAKLRARSAKKAGSFRESATAWMEARAGLTEKPPGSNVVPKLSADGKAAGVGAYYYAMGYAWCAYAAMLAGLIAGSAAAKLGFRGVYNVLYCPAILAQAIADKSDLRRISFDQAQRGDLVLFDWGGDDIADHIGRVRTTPKPGWSTIQTIEGNTSPDSNGSQSDGGGTFARTRNRADVIAIVREL